jgi:cutinase
MTASVKRLTDSTKAKVAGVVLYGDTRNKQENGKIPDFPTDRVLTFCNISDGVCGGALLVTAGHLTYTADVGKAVDFLVERVSALGSGSA